MWPTRIRRFLLQALAVALSLASALMAHTALGLLTNCKSPAVVVLSASMEPGVRRGDLLLLSNYAPQRYANGDITVYQVPGHAIPIVHRVLQTHDSPLTQQFLTKGDNNDVDDLALYDGLEWLEAAHVVGKVQGIIPFVGYVSILFNEMPRMRNGVFGIIGLASLFSS